MATSSKYLRVHLDHLIKRQSIRYISTFDDKQDKIPKMTGFGQAGQEDRSIRYDDIRRNEWFPLLRKPDFQRETNAWTPEDCVQFLDSVVNGRIIPSIILWSNQENSLIYVLDGSHRLSVIRAWMSDDWGDKAGDYYERRDMALIREAADKTRESVRQKIGLFHDFNSAWTEQHEIVEQGKAPKAVMSSKRFAQATFYNKVAVGHLTLSVQWERGDYFSAEQSFLRINRSGQALDPWEATLIENRKGSYARAIMSIANGGESGHYWPGPNEDSKTSNDLLQIVEGFHDKAADIYKRLFVPPFKVPITGLNVPFMVAPAYFQKHKYLLEIIPLIVHGEIAVNEDQQIELMKKDVEGSAENVIRNGDKILNSMIKGLDHMISPDHSSKSLSIVPLFYFYNQKGQYTRGIFYGFVYWLLSGTDDEISSRKLIFSANRDRFEHILFDLKPEIATIQERGGAGLKAIKRAVDFFQGFLELLQDNPKAQGNELLDAVIEILKVQARLRQVSRKSRRVYSKRDKNQINIRELFENAIRCHICGAAVDLQSGLQYDHVVDYAKTGLTDPDTGKPTHPFCNRYKNQILALRDGIENIILPSISVGKESEKAKTQQLAFWGEEDFPD